MDEEKLKDNFNLQHVLHLLNVFKSQDQAIVAVIWIPAFKRKAEVMNKSILKNYTTRVGAVNMI